MKKWWNGIRIWIKLVIAVATIVVVTVSAMLLVNFHSLRAERAKTEELSFSYLSNLADVYSSDLRNIINAGISLQYNKQVIDLFEQADAATTDEYLQARIKAMADMILLNREIIDVILFTADQRAFYCAESGNLEIYESLCPPELFQGKAPTGSFFMPLGRSDQSYQYSGAKYLYAVDVYSYPNVVGSRQFLGTIVFACKLGSYQNIVIDDIALRISDGENILLNQNFTDEMRQKGNVHARQLLYSGWTMELCYLSGDSLRATVSSLLAMLAGIALVSVLAVYLLFYFEVQRPLSRLADELNRFGPGETGVTVCPQRDIGEICEHINAMLETQLLLAEKNKKYIKDQYELLMGQRQAQISALRSQINPHFLYNTLECINGLAAVYQVAPIQQIAVSMGNIFRYAIKGSDTVPVRQEMSIIADYGRIISLRYNGLYQVHMNVDDALLDFPIPRMILQPLVENAVEHGFRQKQEGNLWVRGYKKGEFVVFEVINDGAPIDQETLALLRSHLVTLPEMNGDAKIGILNVIRRLQLFYGDLFRMEIDSARGKQTVFRLFLPLEQIPKT